MASKFEFKYLIINKEHFGNGLKAIDLLILSQVEEFERNDRPCYMTDEQFMYITGAGKSAVRDALQRLEDKQIIIRNTKVVERNYEDVILKNNSCYIEKQYIRNKEKDNKNIILEETSSSKAKIQSTIRYY